MNDETTTFENTFETSFKTFPSMATSILNKEGISYGKFLIVMEGDTKGELSTVGEEIEVALSLNIN